MEQTQAPTTHGAHNNDLTTGAHKYCNMAAGAVATILQLALTVKVVGACDEGALASCLDSAILHPTPSWYSDLLRVVEHNRHELRVVLNLHCGALAL